MAILAGALRWYAGEHERDCLAEVRAARDRLWDGTQVEPPLADSPQSSGKGDDVKGSIVGRASGGPPAKLTHGFHTRLSNVHACVASLRALRADCPLLWRGGGGEGGGGADSSVSPSPARVSSVDSGAVADRAAAKRGRA